MKKKSKRIWSDEQRQAAADRMRKMVLARQAKKAGVVDAPSVPEVQAVEAVVWKKERAPEVQAVIDSMSPERKAKLAAMQAKVLSTGFTSDKERVEAMLRHDAARVRGLEVPTEASALSMDHSVAVLENPVTMSANAVLPPARIGSREVNLIVRTDGTMVSVNGPCLCGVNKREWHRICVGGGA